MASPTVSVIIGTYNRGARIGRTLDSVVTQSSPASEIIVVDDGSTDDTAAWIQANYPSVRVLTFANGGTSVARNRGAAAATSDVLVFLDHDDDMQPHALETLTGLLRRFPEARAAYADHTLRDVTTGEFWPNHHTANVAFHRMRGIRPIRLDGTDRLYGRSMHDALLWGNVLQQPWAIYRSAFMGVGGFDREIRYCEDWDMYLRVTRMFQVAVSDTVISHHYIEGENLHRAAGQDVQHMNVLRKHIGTTSRWSLRTQATLRRRLALYHKAAGDRQRASGQASALDSYLAAFRSWPFDHVVVARCVLWSIGGR